MDKRRFSKNHDGGIKRIAVVQFYFYPDISAVSQLLGDLLGEIVKDKRYDITVFCGRSLYTKKIVADTDKNTFSYTNVRIKRIITSNFGKRSFITRIIDFLIYYIAIFFIFLINNVWDAVIVMTSPPFIGSVISVSTIFSRIPFIYYIQDLYPELLYDIGYIKKPWLIRKLRGLNNIIFRRVNRIITIGEYMTKRILDNYKRTRRKIIEINNWTANIDYTERKRSDRFILLYSGNMGLAHDFSKLGMLIRRMKEVDCISYRFVGGGEAKEEIERTFGSEEEKRVYFKGYTIRADHCNVISDADLFIIAQKRETIGDILPSKLYSYLASGRPILFLGPRNSEIGKIILNNDIGVVLETEDDIEMAARYIENLTVNQGLCIAIGRRAKRIFDNKYKLSYSVQKFKNCLEEIS